jgi:xanthine/uracil/vitamin C permease (AzgA family)
VTSIANFVVIPFGFEFAATKAANKKGTLVPMLKKAGVLKDKEEESRKFEAEAAKAVEEEAVGAFPSKDIVV